MELGLFVTPYYDDAAAPAAAADALLERARVGADAGYGYVQVGDHHVTREGYFFQNVPTAARLAGAFDHVAALFLLPLYHPVQVAEYVGTLGAFTDRLDLWTAVGGNADAFDAFAVPMGERGRRFAEGLALVERLLADDGSGVDFDGDFYRVEGVSVAPRADPRVCIGGLAEPAVRRAGRRGDAWVAHPSEGLDDLAEKVGWFRDAGGETVIVRRDALVLDDGDEAREVTDAILQSGYRGWPADAECPLVGDPDDVAADLERLAELGADEVVVGAMSHDHALGTVAGVAAARDRL